MNQEIAKVNKIARETAEGLGLLLIECIIRGTKSNPVIEVFIDGSKDISAEICKSVSTLMKKIIDEQNLFSSYRLDVSSPGVDRPLTFIEQYLKHLNRLFHVEYKTGDEVKKINARLTGIEDYILTFFSDTEIKIRFQDILKAKVLVSFNQRR
jgi:ribosome maturation factor RimP